MTIRRVALIYDNQHRPETTGFYCHRALEDLVGEVVHFLPGQLQDIPRTGFDLYLNIDDGLRYRLPHELRPSAWWVIDTHLDADWAEQKGHDFDWLFAAQRDGAERLAERRMPAQWLPLACDPQVHKPHHVAKLWDVSFVGWICPGPRQEMLALVQQQFPNSFVGQKYFDDYAKTCSESRVGFNRSVKNDVNMRVFETLGCGTLLVTNDLRDNGQEELLKSDTHLVTYQGAEELLDKLRFYISHDEARERIAQAGYAEAISRHTYRHRMQSLLEAVEARSTECVANRRIQTQEPVHSNGDSDLLANAFVPLPIALANREAKATESNVPSNGQVCCGSPMNRNGRSDDFNRHLKAGLLQVDVIIKTFLRPQALLRLLDSILEFYPQIHVTIADDGNLRGSTDPDSRACCQLIDSIDNFTLHTLPFAAGVTPGRNLLVDRTQRPFLLLLDDDFCLTAETKIERFLERLQADPELGVIAGSCIDVVGDERRPRNSGGTLRTEGDTLLVDSASWRDRESGLRDYVPHFALIRREVFQSVRWEGGLGAEHYDFCLQLQRSNWKVAQDLSLTIDHYHFTPTLPGYAEHRFNYADAQQWLLKKWQLHRIVQDGQTIVESSRAGQTCSGTHPPPSGREAQPSAHFPAEEIARSQGNLLLSQASLRKDETPAPLDQNRYPNLENHSRLLPEKDASYFEFPRPEVVALIPATARRVLDIGCGAGALGALLKERQPAEVIGIELQPVAAAAARHRLDQVLERSADDPALEFAVGAFDCIVCADILEHLREPGQMLQKIRKWLTLDGMVVASLPNTRHHSVVGALIEGNWTYETAGLLDSDHVRFFTRREIEKLFYRAGFDIQQLESIPGSGYEEWRQAGHPGEVSIGAMHVSGFAPEIAHEFFTYQFLVVGRPAVRVASKLTSIIIVTHNQCAFTKECVDSIRLRTDEPYELIFVDNGSTDGTVGYLRDVVHSIGSTSGHTLGAGYGLQSAQLVKNTDNRGFPAAVNQGLKIAHGNYVVLLNNDTVVTTRWLQRMHDAFESDSRIGLVGPCSNCVSGSQMVPTDYHDIAALDGFAWDWGKQHDGLIEDTDRLIGFCLGFKRTVVDQIGLFDERFGIGCFEDDDFCLRAIHAGWRTVIARSAFVHHYGSRTFQGSGVDLGSVLHVNRQKFLDKWSNTPPLSNGEAEGAARSSEQFAIDHDAKPSAVSLPASRAAPELQPPASKSRFRLMSSPSGGLLLKLSPTNDDTSEMPEAFVAGTVGIQPTGTETVAKPRLSLCMIVRDNETTIGPALKTIRPYVDEIIVVDTGSKDQTPEICRQHGARMFEFPWCDDFSAARNESLKHARGEWIFWMDSDDTISPECGRKLRQLSDGPHADNVLGYIIQVHCPGPGEQGQFDVTAVDHVKLVRNRPDLRFEGRIHEQMLPAIRRAGGEVAWTDIHVRHSGSDHSPEGWQRKLERDLRILHRELQDTPNHPFVLFNLGMTYADAKRHEEAIDFLDKCLAASSSDESHLRKAYSLMVSSLSQADRHDSAWKFCQEGLALYPDDKELLFRSAILQHHFGRLYEAEATYRRVLHGDELRHFSSVDQGLAGFKARHNLAIVYDEMGRPELAEAEWKHIVEEVPDYHLGWRGLGECLLRQGRFADVQVLCDRLSEMNGLVRREGRILRGKLAAARGDLTSAIRELRASDQGDLSDLEPLQVLCRILFEQGDPSTAEAALHELTERAPSDPAALHNLGTVRQALKKHAEAAVAFRDSLKLRPNSALTYLQLGYALNDSGAPQDAATAWKTVLRFDPSNTEARAALSAL